jgi:hypothetical protein
MPEQWVTSSTQEMQQTGQQDQASNGLFGDKRSPCRVYDFEPLNNRINLAQIDKETRCWDVRTSLTYVAGTSGACIFLSPAFEQGSASEPKMHGLNINKLAEEGRYGHL